MRNLIRRVFVLSSILAFQLYGNSISAQEAVNKFSDPVIRNIHELADRRDSTGLLPYLRDSNPIYRGEALMCFGSIQAGSMVDSLAPALNAELNGIRMAAAFALGQTYNPGAVPIIREALERDTVKLVRGMLFDALGKTGNKQDLKWMAGLGVDYQDSEGLAQGILRFALRDITLPEANLRMLNILKEGTSTVGLIYASYHLGRYADTVWLAGYMEEMQELYRDESDPVVSANLISGIVKGMKDDAGPAVITVINADVDYRIKVNAMKSLGPGSWEEVSKLIFKTSLSDNPNIAVAASEAIQRFAAEEDLKDIARTIKRTVNWRSRSLLLGKALEIVSNDRDRAEKITSQITEAFLESQNTYEKAWLLKSLSSYPFAYKFVEGQLASGQAVIRTYAMETLTGMAASKLFNKASDDLKAQGVDLKADFMNIIRKGIQSNDIAMVSLASSVLRNDDLPFKAAITDTGFIREALDHPIDWERVMKIPPRQFVGIATSKGDIIVQMNVNWCPGTVSAFLELAEAGFYNGKTIHRVVPNFVAQDGCPRGDGWGGPPFTIRSEFTPAPFLEGTFGMASAGKDTEGSQWYFTHTATPHLDGKYTNFGHVVEGIEIVHMLEVGDTIERVVVIKDEINQ